MSNIFNDTLRKIEKYSSEDYFFVFDSDTIESINTTLYGYIVTTKGIFNANNLSQLNEKPDGCGCYIFIKRTKNKIRIEQDFNGSIGLYIYRYGNYFALSNSIWYLIDRLKERWPLSLNMDYANCLLTADLCSMSSDLTLINEIELLRKEQYIEINLHNKELVILDKTYVYNKYNIDSPEGISLLDNWYDKWSCIFKYVYEKSGRPSEN